MRSSIIFAAMLSIVSMPSAVLAQAAAANVKAGMMVTSSDGKRIGRVYDVDKAKDGTVNSVSIIRDSRLIHVSASTLSSTDKGLTTSLTRADVAKLK